MQPDSNILQVNNLSKFFGGLAAVSNCSLKIKKGSITGIIGPNGSGKTTLFNLIAGNLESSQGTVLFDNEDIEMNVCMHGDNTLVSEVYKTSKQADKVYYTNLITKQAA